MNKSIDAVCWFLCEKFECFFLVHDMFDAFTIFDRFFFDGLDMMCYTLQTKSRF